VDPRSALTHDDGAARDLLATDGTVTFAHFGDDRKRVSITPVATGPSSLSSTETEPARKAEKATTAKPA
jgi:hypothetical protein